MHTQRISHIQLDYRNWRFQMKPNTQDCVRCMRLGCPPTCDSTPLHPKRGSDGRLSARPLCQRSSSLLKEREYNTISPLGWQAAKLKSRIKSGRGRPLSQWWAGCGGVKRLRPHERSLFDSAPYERRCTQPLTTAKAWQAEADNLSAQ